MQLSKEEIYGKLLDSTILITHDYHSIFVQINGFEGVPITIYAKNDNNKILAKAGKYSKYNHGFTISKISIERVHLLTVFMKIRGENISFNLLLSLLKKISTLDSYENDAEYLEYLSLEYSKVAQKIIRSNDTDLTQNAHIAPSFIDSSDAKVIARNGIGYSFKNCVTNSLLRRRLPEKNEILNGFSKKDTAEFLKSRGFKVPLIYEYNVDIESVLKYEKCIIKPINGAGSKGIFIKNADEYLDLRDKQILTEYEDFKIKYSSYTSLNILIEELVADEKEVAHDIKVYCFYGKSILALEIVRSGSKNTYCYYDNSLNIVNTGQYKDSELFEGKGFDVEILNVAKEISLLIPLPFVRVDFLVSKNDYRLGEITPIPGFYSRFSTSYDKKLGKEYLEAENRLNKDLLNGKVFSFKY